MHFGEGLICFGVGFGEILKVNNGLAGNIENYRQEVKKFTELLIAIVEE
jgi:hypothetical protein